MPFPYARLQGTPPAGTVLCRAADIAPGQAHVATFRSGSLLFEMFVLRPPAGQEVAEAAATDGLVAYVNDCPHANTPLDWQPGQFLSADRQFILCATHGARFRIRDGYCIHGPCIGASLIAVPIALRDGSVVIAESG